MKIPLFIGIVGSRRRNSLADMRMVREIVRKCVAKYVDREVVIVSGGCPTGADRYAEDCATFFGLRTVIHPIDGIGAKIEHRGDFTRMAYARNELIARDSEILFALVHSDRRGGTENTIGHALRFNKKVFLVGEDGLLYLQKSVREETTDASGVAPGPVQGKPEDDPPPF